MDEGETYSIRKWIHTELNNKLLHLENGEDRGNDAKNCSDKDGVAKSKKPVGSINIEHANSLIIAWTGILWHVKKCVIIANVGILDACYFIKLHAKSTVSKAIVQEKMLVHPPSQN